MATQSKQRSDISFDFDSQAVIGESSLENPNTNLDYPSSSLGYDQVIYSYLNSYETLENHDNAVNAKLLIDVEQDTEPTPADSMANSSATLSIEEIISDEIESSLSEDTNENLTDVGTGQAIIMTEPVNAVIDEHDFYITSENVSIGPHDIMPFDSFIIANENYLSNLDPSLVMDDDQNQTSANAEDTLKSTIVDNSVTDDLNFFGEASIGCPVYDDLIVIDETFSIEPLMIDDTSDLEEFITDETTTGIYDQIAPTLADEDFYSDDLIETDFDISEETSEDPFDYFAEEPIEDYEMPNDVLVDDGSYIPTESIDDNTDPLTKVTDEPFTIYSYFYCGTMDASYSLVEYIDEPDQLDDLDFSLAVCDISIDDLTFDDTPIDNLNEVAADDLTIIPLGLPISPDYGWDWGWCCL